MLSIRCSPLPPGTDFCSELRTCVALAFFFSFLVVRKLGPPMAGEMNRAATNVTATALGTSHGRSRFIGGTLLRRLGQPLALLQHRLEQVAVLVDPLQHLAGLEGEAVRLLV